MSDEEKRPPEIKVTDRRMFTPDGRLREDVEEPEPAAADSAAPAASDEPRAPAAASEPPAAAPPPSSPPPGADEGPPLELPGTPEGLGAPTFFDLLAVLAEPAAVYLGEAQLPDGQKVEDLRAARFYIDLLTVLREKTAGNLTAEERAPLDQTLYELRLRYVQKRG